MVSASPGADFVFFLSVCAQICGLNTSEHYARFGLFYLLVLLTTQMGFAQSEFFALVSPTPSSAYVIQGAAATIFSLFSGFLIASTWHTHQHIVSSVCQAFSHSGLPLTQTVSCVFLVCAMVIFRGKHARGLVVGVLSVDNANTQTNKSLPVKN
jgi:hypothetical protein